MHIWDTFMDHIAPRRLCNVVLIFFIGRLLNRLSNAQRIFSTNAAQTKPENTQSISAVLLLALMKNLSLCD